VRVNRTRSGNDRGEKSRMRGGASDLSADRVDCFLYSIAGRWLKQCGRIFFEMIPGVGMAGNLSPRVYTDSHGSNKATPIIF